MKDKIFFISIFSFLVGVFLRSFLFFPNYVLWFLASVSFILVVFFIFLKQKTLFFVVLGMTFLLFGVLRFEFFDNLRQKNVFDEYVGEEVELQGFILDEPAINDKNQKIVVSFQKNNVLVTTEVYPNFSYGDEVLVKGKLQKPKNFITDIGKDFDYVGYLSKDDIFYTISFADVSLVSSGNGHFVKSLLLSFKNKFISNIEEIIKEPESSLVGGILLGIKSSIPKDLKDAFINTGLVHIVVLSGYNVTIVAESLIKILYFLPAVVSFSFGILSIILFALMVGGGSTILRASIMAIISLIARKTGNQYSITRALIFAGFIMVLINPYILYFDISFQLSFLATIGLIYMTPIFEKYLYFLPEKFGLREIGSSTVGVQVFVLPFILYKMGNLSLIAPITNILVLPFIPLTMLLGFVTGFISFISYFLALPFGFLTEKLISLEIFIVNIFSSLPFSHLYIKQFPLVLVVIIYLFIFWVIYKDNERGRKNKS